MRTQLHVVDFKNESKEVSHICFYVCDHDFIPTVASEGESEPGFTKRAVMEARLTCFNKHDTCTLPGLKTDTEHLHFTCNRAKPQKKNPANRSICISALLKFYLSPVKDSDSLHSKTPFVISIWMAVYVWSRRSDRDVKLRMACRVAPTRRVNSNLLWCLPVCEMSCWSGVHTSTRSRVHASVLIIGPKTQRGRSRRQVHLTRTESARLIRPTLQHQWEVLLLCFGE